MTSLVDTSVGPGRLYVSPAATPRAALLLGHGAGGGVDAVDLAAMAAGLPGRGITVVLLEQPWRTAGKRAAARPGVLDQAWREMLPAVRGIVGHLPLAVGGRSAGARVACRTADDVGATAVVALAFPLHPPGHPERSRLAELLAPRCDVLVLQGDRDTFGTAADLAPAVAGHPHVRVVPVPGADHGMKVLKSGAVTPDQVAALLVEEVARFLGA